MFVPSTALQLSSSSGSFSRDSSDTRKRKADGGRETVSLSALSVLSSKLLHGSPRRGFGKLHLPHSWTASGGSYRTRPTPRTSQGGPRSRPPQPSGIGVG